MQIIGFNLTKISVERKKELDKGLKINSDLQIVDIQKQDVDFVTDSDALSFEFEIKISYGDDDDRESIGSVDFKGVSILSFDKKQSKSIIDKWKSKSIPDEVRIPLFNFLLAKCTSKALSLEDDVGLPFHFPMPRISFPDSAGAQKSEEQGPGGDYIG